MSAIGDLAEAVILLGDAPERVTATLAAQIEELVARAQEKRGRAASMLHHAAKAEITA